MSSGVMDSCFSISSTTPRPPVWMHTCSKASLKSGMYGLHPPLQHLQALSHTIAASNLANFQFVS